MPIALLTLHLYLPGCTSLKEKRGRIKPVLARLHNRYNLSAAEVDRQDMWQEAIIVCVVVSNQKAHAIQVLQEAIAYLEKNWKDINILENRIEII